ncbi:hypothetical protein [Eubacterium sp. 1001713B170207_170306_E7]|uniref:hypothetical protein n=1 Tax=Eubacterium sp. 1001713B170207_170306_E7 TaxID=2787097 RepID=UPI001899A136|nr:hypothetical protein [Eubacterium sp. 1001713B170207_170306_E7]
MKIKTEAIQRAGLETVCASFKKSRQAPESRRYAGVPFKTLADNTGQAVSRENICIFKALDGFSIALTGDEALDAEQCFIAVHEDGELLTLDDGTPYCMMLMLKDTTSQRWCRYLKEVDIRE